MKTAFFCGAHSGALFGIMLGVLHYFHWLNLQAVVIATLVYSVAVGFSTAYNTKIVREFSSYLDKNNLG